MSLPDARRPEQQNILAIGGPAALAEISNLFGIEGGLGLKVEASHIVEYREVGEFQRHLNASVVFFSDLPLAEER